MEIRLVELPEVAGQLFVCHLPGRYETFAEARESISERGIDKVVCLATLPEIRQEAPEYFDAIQAGDLPWVQVNFPIPDRGVPTDLSPLLRTVEDLVEDLRNKKNILLHCVAGVGRTGTVAMCVLIGIGLDPLDASVRLADAEAGPESDSQETLVNHVAELRI
ncbi:MAG: protein-tyrosine phosphatase family protein [Acidobacteriota bacterium]